MTKLNKTPKNRWVECVTGGCHGLVHARPPAENSLLRAQWLPAGYSNKNNFLTTRKGTSTVACVARAKRRWRGEGEKVEIPLPFSLPPYPLHFSTSATQATSTEDRASVSSCTSVHRSVDLRTYCPLLIIKREILRDYDTGAVVSLWPSAFTRKTM